MVNGDIHFVLTGEFRREMIDNMETYFYNSYIVDPTFVVSVHGQGRVVTACTLLKNGLPYTGAEVTPVGVNEYRVMDIGVLRAGNASYGVRVAMNDGGVYERHFFIKIPQGVESNDVKFVSLTAYGLLENFSPVRVLTTVDAVHPVDCVLLSRRVDAGPWETLGEMCASGKGYVWDDVQFFLNMADPKRVVYRAQVRTANGHTATRDLLVVINPHTLSLNTVDAAYADGVNTLRGGVVGRLTDPLNDFCGATARVLMDLSDAPTPNRTVHVNMTLDDLTLDVHAEGFEATFPQFFNPNRTDISPNLYLVDGGCAVTVRRGDRVWMDSGRLRLSMRCGESVVTEFTLTPDNLGEFAVSSGRVTNDLVEFSTGGAAEVVLDGACEDVEAAEGALTGFLTVANGGVKFIDCADWSAWSVGIDRVQEMINQAHWLTFTADRLTGYMAESDGLVVWTFDGLNFAETLARVTLQPATVREFSQGMCPIRHTSTDDLELTFLDWDGVETLRWVTVLNDAVQVDDLSFQLSTLFNGLDARLVSTVENMTTVDDDVLMYTMTLTGVDAEPVHSFTRMPLTNDVQGFTMLSLKVQQSFPVTLSAVVPTTGTTLTVAGRLNADMTASVRVGRYAAEVEAVRLKSKLQAGSLSFSMDDEVPNQVPANIMERSNDTFFVKFEGGRTTRDVDDYGRFLRCVVYESTSRLCTVPLAAIYGPGCAETVFRYVDAAKLRVIHRGSVAWLINVRNDRTLISRVNVIEDELIDVHEVATNAVFAAFLRRDAAHLETLAAVFAGDGRAAFVNRTMHLVSVSDLTRQMYVYNLLDKPLAMTKVDNRVCSKNEGAVTWTADVDVDWPLSIKSRQTMLVYPSIEPKRR